ncbi:MAG: J domain-containing protein [Chloroflexi bacterium]|nr:MAG: J domain-containing protein [Chloroflexota bacterium]
MTQRFLPYTPDRDIYRLLQVDPRAGPDEIMDAWRRLARTFHPDRNGSQRATEEMQVVNAVRDLLSDPAARAEYDRERHRWMASPVPADRTNRWRTLAGTAQPQPAAELTPVSGPSLGESRLGRTATALGIGLRAFAVELMPARCTVCRGTIGRSDTHCWVCGFPTTTPRRP